MGKNIFDELRSTYEQGHDLDKISHSKSSLLFLKIRALTKPVLRELCINKKILKEEDKKSIWELMELAFLHSDPNEINKIITDNRATTQNIEDKESLIEGLKGVQTHKSRVHNDNLNTLINRIARDKSIKNLTDLDQKIDDKVIPTAKSYMKWSWFNTKSTLFVEDIFNRHSKIIPTLRKVKSVDFFVKFNGKELPMDLKMTHLPVEFQKEYSKKGKSIEEIKSLVKKNPKILADWLYANQHPRQFNNNIRFLIVFIDNTNIENSWKLKADINMIHPKLSNFLDNVNESDLIDVQYEYTKERKVNGTYKTKCVLFFIEN